MVQRHCATNGLVKKAPPPTNVEGRRQSDLIHTELEGTWRNPSLENLAELPTTGITSIRSMTRASFDTITGWEPLTTLLTYVDLELDKFPRPHDLSANSALGGHSGMGI